MNLDPTDPFKLHALHALTDCIKEITPDNGYGHNLADFDPGDGVPMERVFRGRLWFGDESPIPMVSVLEPGEEADLIAGGNADDTSGSYEWPLVVQGFVEDDQTHPTDPAYRLMRDVRRRLIREKKRTLPGRHSPDPLGSSQWGKEGCRITDLRVSSGRVRPADDISAKAYFVIIVTLVITEDAERA